MVTLIHWYSYLILLKIVVRYRKLRRYQETHANVSVLLEKPDIPYPLRNSYYEISTAKLQS